MFFVFLSVNCPYLAVCYCCISYLRGFTNVLKSFSTHYKAVSVLVLVKVVIKEIFFHFFLNG